MRFFINIILATTFITLLTSCGVDKLNTKKTSSNPQALTASKQCGCTSSYSPVCGTDGKNYDNICIAQCFGTPIKNSGHCDCATNNVPVCGVDGKSYSECEAISANVAIVKFIPCEASEI